MNDKMKAKVISVGISAVCAVFALASYFLLPERIFVEILSGRVPETVTSIFLLIGTMIIVLAGMMCFYGREPKKWLALQSVLAIAFIGCLVYNHIVL